MNELVHAVVAVKADESEDARRPISLALETVGVAIGTLAIVRLLHGCPGGPPRWLAIPCVLVVAAMLPTWAGQRDFPRIGLHAEPLRRALKTVLWVSVCVFPPVFLGLWLLALSGLPTPLRPVLAEQQGWLTWLLYQFLYVAVSEEVFFRGYIQANTMRLLHARHLSQPAQQSIAIAVSAGCFALAHVVVQGQIISVLTFLPGLLMAWLFVRTRSLLAPILFHGLANVSYGIMAMTFA